MIPKLKASSDLFRSTGILIILLIIAGVVLKLSAGDPKADAWWQQPSPLPQAKKASPEAAPNPTGTSSPMNRSRTRASDSGAAASESVLNARALVDQNRWSEAEKVLTAYLKQNPQSEAALIEMAMIQMLDKQDSAAARPYLEQALTINTQNEVVVHELLRIYQDGRSWEEGLNFMRSLPNDSPYVSFGVGSILLELNRPVEAAEVLHRTVYEAGYQAYDVRETLAESMWSAGRGDEALEEFAAVIDGPYKPAQLRAAKIRMASLLMERGQTEEARGMLQGLQEADPNDEWVAYLMGQLGEARY